jgi:hypothetical protein
MIGEADSMKINNLEYCICSWFSGNKFLFSKVPECSYLDKAFGHEQIKTGQEEAQVSY